MLQIIFWHISAAGRKTFLIQSGTVARSRHISTAGEMAEKPFLSTPALLPGPGTSPLQKRRQINLSYPVRHCCQAPARFPDLFVQNIQQNNKLFCSFINVNYMGFWKRLNNTYTATNIPWPQDFYGLVWVICRNFFRPPGNSATPELDRSICIWFLMQ